MYKNLFGMAHKQMAEIQHLLNAQFLTTPEWVMITGGEQPTFAELMPNDLAAKVAFDFESAEESLDRNERRQESLQLFNTVAASLQSFAMLAPATKGQMPALPQFLRDLMEAYGKTNVDHYLVELPPPPAPEPPPPPAGPLQSQLGIGPGTPLGGGNARPGQPHQPPTQLPPFHAH
jgi:hypothetical protein